MADPITGLSDALGIKGLLDDAADSVGDWVRDNPELAAVGVGLLTGGLAGPTAGLVAGTASYGAIQGRNQADAMKKAQQQQEAAIQDAKRRQQALIERQNRERQRAQKFSGLAAETARQQARAGMSAKSFARGTLLSSGGVSDNQLMLGRKTLLGQ